MKFAPDTGASDCRKTSFVDKKGVAGAEPPTGTRGGRVDCQVKCNTF